jgi:C-terminal processing protease CtpA/Prc
MEYGVIGLNALLLMNSANPVVQTVMPGAPAETAGIRPGDLIVKARDHVFKSGEGQRVLWQLVAGRAGTPVEMTVLRGGELLKFNMLRMNIEDLPDKRARRQYEILLSALGAPHYDEDGDLADSAAKDSHELKRLRVLR